MKRIILPFIICFIILTTANISFATTATVNVTAVRIRESASTDSNIITNIYKEDEVEILEENGEWYKVQYEGKVGYAKAEFFTKSEKTTEQSPTEVQNEVISENLVPNEPINTSESPVQENTEIQREYEIGENITLSNTIYIRLLPNLLSTSKTEVLQGTNIIIEAKLGNWYKVTGQNIAGWITSQKLIEGMNSIEPSVEAPQEPQEPTTTEPEQTPNNEVVENTENTVSEETTQPSQEPQETTTTNREAVVIVETARVRSAASTTSNIVDVLDEDDIVTITGEEGDFYKISTANLEGYISKSLVKEKNVTSRGNADSRENTETVAVNEDMTQSFMQGISNSVTGEEIIEFAKQYLGYPYVLRLQYARKWI